MPIPEDVNIDCPLQRTGMGNLLCRAAVTGRGSSTDEVDEEVCYNCDAGRIYRDIGCKEFTPKVVVFASQCLGQKPSFLHRLENIFCKKRMRSTTFEYCQSCSLVNAPSSQRIYKETLDFFEAGGFKSSRDFLEDAKKKLSGENLDIDGCITASVSCLESTLKTILDKLEEPYPRSEQLTTLWSLTKNKILLGDKSALPYLEQIVGSLSGAVSGLAGLRNALSDAHGKGLIKPEVCVSYAELAMNLAATASTFLIRRFKEVRK